MDTEWLAQLGAQWQGLLSLYAFVGIIALSLGSGWLITRIPAIGAEARVNRDTLAKRREKPSYVENQNWNRKWALLFQLIIFTAILPFCLKPGLPSIGALLLDCVVILMVYDFFYYLTHRFLFHDSDFLGGPLKWMHAIHHRQHNPCRMDSSYIHPLEVAIGLGLYVATIAALAAIMGRFDVVTVVVTFFAFSQINLHNHNLWRGAVPLGLCQVRLGHAPSPPRQVHRRQLRDDHPALRLDVRHARPRRGRLFGNDAEEKSVGANAVHRIFAPMFL